MRAAQRGDFPGSDGAWRASVERRLRERFTLATTRPGVGDEHGVEEIVEGDHIDVDATDPARPVVSAHGFVQGILPGAGVVVDDSDPVFPVVSVDLNIEVPLPDFTNTDAVTAAGPGDLQLVLSHVPVDGSLHVQLDGIWQAPGDWTFDAPTNTVTLLDPGSHIKVGDVMTAAYASGTPFTLGTATPLDHLTPVGGATHTTSGTSLALPAGTAIGQTVVVGLARQYYTGAPGSATIDDPRFTQVSYNTWICADLPTLDPISISNPATDRITVRAATFDAPADFKNRTQVGPYGPGDGTFTAPTVESTAAVLVVTTENRNGTGSISAVPAGYTGVDNSGNGVCSVNIYYWVDSGETVSPAGDISFHSHAVSGKVYATAVGLQDNP